MSVFYVCEVACTKLFRHLLALFGIIRKPSFGQNGDAPDFGSVQRGNFSTGQAKVKDKRKYNTTTTAQKLLDKMHIAIHVKFSPSGVEQTLSGCDYEPTARAWNRASSSSPGEGESNTSSPSPGA